MGGEGFTDETPGLMMAWGMLTKASEVQEAWKHGQRSCVWFSSEPCAWEHMPQM